MRILQVTNIISHHQLPLARCLASLVGENNFRFAVTEALHQERQRLGWSSEASEPWILRTGESDADRQEFERWWDTADVVFCGERLYDLMEQRVQQKKLTFYMSERWFKPPVGAARLMFPNYIMMVLRFRRLAASPCFHYLPMGAYAVTDMRRIARFPGRMWRWGYFTATPEPVPSSDRADSGIKVLWAGRMLNWKRVDTLIRAFSQLVSSQPDATLTLVGDGPQRPALVQLATRLLPPDSFRFMDPQPVAEIARLMRQHHIYVLPSTGAEGWGGVVNESMVEGCVIIASEAAGAAKSIINHGQNGLLFRPGDWQLLGSQLCAVAGDANMRSRLARTGQKTLLERWSPQVAAERLVAVSQAQLAGKPAPGYDDGPMAPL